MVCILDLSPYLSIDVLYSLTIFYINPFTKGLAQLFATKDFKSNKYCGKTGYQSPEIVNRNDQFDAKKNDIWCAGVTLFMLLTCNSPWKVAKKSDAAYEYMTGGFMKGLLKSWGLLKFVDDDCIDLFEGIFQDEDDRMNLKRIQNHSWIVNE